MGAKLKAVRTELILLGLTAVFLGGLLTVSYRDRTTATVTVTAEHTLPPEEVEVTLVDLNTAEAEELATLPARGWRSGSLTTGRSMDPLKARRG